jgi:hypothetical protein
MFSITYENFLNFSRAANSIAGGTAQNA